MQHVGDISGRVAWECDYAIYRNDGWPGNDFGSVQIVISGGEHIAPGIHLLNHISTPVKLNGISRFWNACGGIEDAGGNSIHIIISNLPVSSVALNLFIYSSVKVVTPSVCRAIGIAAILWFAGVSIKCDSNSAKSVGMRLHQSTRLITESFRAQDGDAIHVKMLGLHQPAQGIPRIGRHRATRINSQRQVSKRVVLIKTLGVLIVTGRGFDAAAIAFGLRTPVDFRRAAAHAVVIVKHIVFGVVTRAIHPSQFAIVIVIIKAPRQRITEFVEVFLFGWPVECVIIKELVRPQSIYLIHHLPTLIVEESIDHIRVASAGIKGGLCDESMSIIS